MKMNEEIRCLSGAFLGSEVISVGHTCKPPKGTARFAASDPIADAKPVSSLGVGGVGGYLVCS